mmetsp:Transcript_111165/g.202077  ORF Transcript_111165/g.202077 Transcript_111165/m.202077 type:complete len:669 (-) Transcript_111165:20-2026(-)
MSSADNTVALARDVNDQGKKNRGLQFRCGCFNRLACWKDAGEAEEPLGLNQVVLMPAAKAKPPGPPPAPGKGKGKGKGPAPKPKAKASGGARDRSASAAAVWKGPQPAQACVKKVNWNPIRQQELLEGSVWQRVNQKIDERGHHLLQQDALDKAFMQPVAKPNPKSKSKSQSLGDVTVSRQGRSERRVFAAKEAFIADVLHAQILKHGLGKFEKLQWILGSAQVARTAKRARSPLLNESFSSVASSSSSSSSSSESSNNSSSEGESGSESDDDEKEPVNEDTLQTLLTFLRLADGVEKQLKQGLADTSKDPDSKVPLAAPEKLLQQLLTKVGPGALLQSRVHATLTVTRFHREAEDLERIMRGGVKAAKTILNSSAVPVLLEGVLVLGNYVNSSSHDLGFATGVSLDSIAKLGHTRSLVSDVELQKSPQNALCLIVRQMQRSQDAEWLPSLLSELEGCKSALDLDTAQASATLKDLTEKVKKVNACWHPYVCFQAQLKRFMEQAVPQLEILRALEEEVMSVTGVLRKYFAEPKTSTLTSMMRSLSSLLVFLPKTDEIEAKTPRNSLKTPLQTPRLSLKEDVGQPGRIPRNGPTTPRTLRTPRCSVNTPKSLVNGDGDPSRTLQNSLNGGKTPRASLMEAKLGLEECKLEKLAENPQSPEAQTHIEDPL